MKEKIRVMFDRRVLPYASALEGLASGACPGFFPADVIADGERIQAFFSVEGWHRLRDERQLAPQQILILTKSILRTVDLCRDWLWFPEDYVLSVDTVYTDGAGQTRFLCIPERQKLSEIHQLTGLLHAMKAMTGARGGRYLEECISLLKEEHLRTRRLLAFLDQLLEEEYRFVPV